MTEQIITITAPAQEYLIELLAKQDVEGIAVRVFVENPGSPRAECCMAYCAPDEVEASDIRIDYEGLVAYVQESSVPYLVDAVIDYSKDRMGGQLTFRAPRSRVAHLGENPTMAERINHILQSEVNPSLASHGGNVALVELIEDDSVAILEFGGGCQGCSAVSLTLKDGVEKTLLEKLPELKQVKDVTDHSNKENAYY